ncbi:MAG: Protein containing domain, partial [Ilumatobacteraceae bacterium]|nr:Protein containing domain [Ilumatobacteraceae bacterium]
MLARGGYVPTRGRFDEAMAPDGTLRPSWSELGSSLGEVRPGELLERQRQADRLLDAEGAGHLVHELTFERTSTGGAHTVAPARSRPWRLDPVPLVLGHDDFEQLAAGASQRMRLLEALLVDLAGDQRSIRSGAVPPQVAFRSPTLLSHHREGQGPTPSGRWIVHYAIDVARTATGEWRVVQDLVDAPSGLGYALLNRSVIARVMPDGVRRSGASPIGSFANVLRRGIAAQSPAGRRSPRTVVLTG